MNLGQAHLSVKYEGETDELYNVLIDLTDSTSPNGSENFEISDTEMVAFFYEQGMNEPISTRSFHIFGEPGTCESVWDGEKQEYDCFHIEEIREIPEDKAERLAGLS